MMELWMSSSKEGIAVSAKYNAENEKECNEASEKFQQCISWWNSVPTIHLEEEDTSVDQKIDCEKIRQLNKRMRNVLFGVSGDNESSS